MAATVLFEAADVAELVLRNERRIDLIAQCANEPSRPEFDRKWMSVILRCADWYSSIPLSPELYREPSGAFRWTVETAFYAMRLSGGLKFGTNLPSERRRRIEPQYNYGVFLAAICSGLDEPYRHFDVERTTDCQVWNPSVHGAVGPWLGGARYRMTRRSTPLPVERMRTGMLAHALVGPELLSGLDAEVQAEIFGAINPTQSPQGVETLTHKVVRQAIATAADFDRKAQRAVFEPVTFAVPSAIHVAAELEPKLDPAASSAISLAAAPTPPAESETAARAAATDARGETSIPGPPLPLATAGIDRSSRAASPAAANAAPKAPDQRQMALELPPAAVVNPAEIRQERPGAIVTPAEDRFDEVLRGAPRMISDFFVALQQDVAGGKVKVRWAEKGLVVSKRTIGGYGVASDTLIEHMRRRNLLLANEPTEVTLAPRIGELIQGRDA
ncbi:TraI domain-containing protein [Burkholderia multivorans]|uniref:TraI domain-containing protein n=1 Tax=Burkholderia multivorans TaxID=87883 RepID=UPI002019504D|nr:TraI domain-containing protein [Burkholderia multivorans]MCO1368682.1 TraI domain-containing protein [Burkholderia multivorans]MCO1380573.1 TraI domain-containing protein [Burkholderia multivorans]MDN8032064.1 TraI domain-containing protein [Burkholderia multivorans]UQP22000.1 TraI domain-containing protein [Burkholderia multivorans]UQP91552.1 TraI domain-containing protein [Burkholderia multivorans]